MFIRVNLSPKYLTGLDFIAHQEINEAVGEISLNKTLNPDSTSPLAPLLAKERGTSLSLRIRVSAIRQQSHKFQGL